MIDLPEVPEGHTRVCIDLDGTLAANVWPATHIGNALADGVDALLHYVEQGYEVVVYTARPDSHRERIWSWLRRNGLENAVYDVVTGKPNAGVYLDDRAWRVPWARP